ncbi:MAG: TetR family transcriptional regulator [Clostridiales bacterium]|nr:TetR family transcriptional regulator [Clostridiales bacterium]
MAHNISSIHTKRALSASLKKLMATKELNRISIREIAEDCGLNRQTFYYHFEDIFDLLRWTYTNELLPLLKCDPEDPDWEGRLLVLFRWLDENRTFCLASLDAIGREHLASTVQKELRHHFRRKVILAGTESALGRPTEEYADFLAEFYCQAISGLLESWLRGNLQQSPQELVHHIHLLLDTQTRGLQALQKEAGR